MTKSAEFVEQKRPTQNRIAVKFVSEPQLGTLRDIQAILQTRNVPNNVMDELHHEEINQDLNEAAPDRQTGMDTFASYYKNLKGVAKYLNFEDLIKAQRFDPFRKEIIDQLNYEKMIMFQNKQYFLYKNVLFCKETILNSLFRILCPLISVFVHTEYICASE